MVDVICIINGQYVRMTEAEYSARSAPGPSVPSAPKKIFKADIWRRCTDQEAETLNAVLNGASTRLQNLYWDSQYLSGGAPEYLMIEQAVTAAFGAKRAAEILAPSEQR